MLNWNFSLVTTQGSTAEIRQALYDHLTARLKRFARRYQALLPFEIEFNPDNAIASLESTLTAAQATPYAVYLLIDEYDNFANEVLMAGLSNSQQRYESLVRTVFLTLLFNDTIYIMDSEPALQRDYADFIMIVRPDMRDYELLDILIEFKYVGLGENNLTGEQVRAMDEDDLRALPAVQQAFVTARAKLTGYRETLHEVYGEKLHLRTYTVVAVGFDRLVWEEIA